MYFRFYLECLLPEIVDPLYGKRFELSDIREPEYIQEAQKKITYQGYKQGYIAYKRILYLIKRMYNF